MVARALGGAAARPDAVVAGLARGGMLIAVEVARALGADLEAMIVERIGTPGFEELPLGVVAPSGVSVSQRQVMQAMGLAPSEWQILLRHAAGNQVQRERFYLGSRPLDTLALLDRQVILVDEAVLTGTSMMAAIGVARGAGARHVTVVTPVGVRDSLRSLRRVVDEIVCPVELDSAPHVGGFYTTGLVSDELARSAFLAYRALRSLSCVTAPSSGVLPVMGADADDEV